MNIDFMVGQKLLLAFAGKEGPSPEIIAALKKYRPGGITLFRSLNLGSPAQILELTSSLQQCARDLGMPPLIIATDQEGGQLMAVGDGTPLPGNMALGATGSIELAHKAGEILGRELSALGINVDYAPCADVNINPKNPVVGIRSFGENPHLVAELAAAMIAGIQSQGVAATAKHFPGHGDTVSDSHHGLEHVPHSLERLRSIELPPFRAAIQAGVKLVMTAHLGIPSIDGPDAPPATLSSNIIHGLLRRDLGYDGVVVTDAMDMRAIRQGEFLGEEALLAVKAGADLLLLTSHPEDQARVFNVLSEGVQTKKLAYDEILASYERIHRLKTWISQFKEQPTPGVIQSLEHLRVADLIAERSITLVRDHDHHLPLDPPAGKPIAVILPAPQDLTPADTSSYVRPKLAQFIRQYHPWTKEIRIPYAPGDQEIAEILTAIQDFEIIIAGTINAYQEDQQAKLIRQLLKAGKSIIIVAMRLPYDLVAFPQAPTYLCTYGILEPSMRAAAKAIFGQIEMSGRLPVSIPGLYKAGHFHKTNN